MVYSSIEVNTFHLSLQTPLDKTTTGNSTDSTKESTDGLWEM